MKPSVLLIDDEPSVRFGYRKFLEKSDFSTEEAGSLAEAREAIEGKRFDAILLDMYLPDGNGLDLVPELRETFPDVAIVVITGAGDVPAAVDALKRGADNFLTKPVDMAGLEVFLRKSIEVGGLRRGDISRKRLSKSAESYFGDSPEAIEIKDFAQLASENNSTILVQGETGVGKGVLAKWIHENSSRASESYVEVNCSSLRGDLLASELFGHAKGSFTSAHADREGLVEVADRGTLFLDEIGDMDLAVQAQFLKVIEEKTYRRVGEVKVRHSDFRLICATNQDLQGDSREGKFRADLYFRINVLPITVYPLRQRGGDILKFVEFFLNFLEYDIKELDPLVLAALEKYPWPGNIREMKNVIERATLLARKGPILLKHLPDLSQTTAILGTQFTSSSGIKSLQELEEEHIASVIDSCDGDIQRVSDLLGVSRATLYRKMKRLKEED
jgi:DNA-binding NtrC family response regulator